MMVIHGVPVSLLCFVMCISVEAVQESVRASNQTPCLDAV
jgi:hypothetical protein